MAYDISIGDANNIKNIYQNIKNVKVILAKDFEKIKNHHVFLFEKIKNYYVFLSSPNISFYPYIYYN